MATAEFMSMYVWVLVVNPARYFTSVSMASTRNIGFASCRLDEVYSSWPDLRRLEAHEEH